MEMARSVQVVRFAEYAGLRYERGSRCKKETVKALLHKGDSL